MQCSKLSMAKFWGPSPEQHLSASVRPQHGRVPWPLGIKRVLFYWYIYIYIYIYIQSNLGSRTPRIMNNSVYEQIFRKQSVSDEVLCLELRTRKPSTSWSDKLGVSASAVFVEEWSSRKYSESATPIGESVSCCLYLICLVLCLSFLW
jgi:hypothetical protein